jgi:hypothetical protein
MGTGMVVLKAGQTISFSEEADQGSASGIHGTYPRSPLWKPMILASGSDS